MCVKDMNPYSCLLFYSQQMVPTLDELDIYIYTEKDIYIYIHKEREREREGSQNIKE